MQTQPQVIDFVGGPFDGHCELVEIDPASPSETLIVPVNENMLRMLHGLGRGPKQPVSSLAVYEAFDCGQACTTYRFLGAMRPPAENNRCDHWI